MTGMMFIMPIFVFFFAVNVASGLHYTGVRRMLIKVFQTLLLSNHIKSLQKEAKATAEREREEKKNAPS